MLAPNETPPLLKAGAPQNLGYYERVQAEYDRRPDLPGREVADAAGNPLTKAPWSASKCTCAASQRPPCGYCESGDYSEPCSAPKPTNGLAPPPHKCVTCGRDSLSEHCGGCAPVNPPKQEPAMAMTFGTSALTASDLRQLQFMQQKQEIEKESAMEELRRIELEFSTRVQVANAQAAARTERAKSRHAAIGGLAARCVAELPRLLTRGLIGYGVYAIHDVAQRIWS